MSSPDKYTSDKLLNLSHVDLNIDYTSGTSDLMEDFYIPCLNEAIRYERAAAYFRSSVYHLIGVAVSEFALRKGIMKLVCSPSFGAEDYEILLRHQTSDSDVSNSLEKDVEVILSKPMGLPVIELFGTLLASNTLQVKIAYRPNSPGIFHMKLGIFSDTDGNYVTFNGSENETAMAWDRSMNYESFDVFNSWQGGEREIKRIDSHKKYFENLWSDNIPNLRVVPLPDVPKHIIEQHANPEGLTAAIEKFRTNFNRVSKSSSGVSKEPQTHQVLAIQNWWKNKRGIIDHVTGAGKTYTSLCLISEWFSEKGASVIILVPSNLLADQWEREIRSELSNLAIRILKIGGPNAIHKGIDQVANFTHPRNPQMPVIIATMQSACKDKFIDKVYAGDHLLIIADEVHKIGSAEHRKALKLNVGGKLGLSATPKRFFDPEGTSAIFKYFGDILEPSFGIKEAQKAGRLVEYDYFIHTVLLTDEEQKKYDDYTKIILIQREKNNRGQVADESNIERLLHMRAQILKKAENKVDIARNIMLKEFKHNSSHRWLIYCDDNEQLEEVAEILRKNGIDSQIYTSDMIASKKETIEIFERYGGVLLSIHCLDEGIDIPNISHALILASSVNPREHLQRRGRVLRKVKGKHSAYIHDVLVGIDDEGTFKVFKSEAERGKIIAEEARNDHVKHVISVLLDSNSDDKNIDFESDETTMSIV